MNSLQALIEAKVDNVTFNVMQTAEKFADSETQNLLIEKESPRVKFRYVTCVVPSTVYLVVPTLFL